MYIYIYIYTHLYVTYLMVGTQFVLFFSTFPGTQACTEAAVFHCDVIEVV